MAQTHITEVMMDDKPIDASKEIAMVFSIANTLRGPYKADRYKDVIIPMIILRRIECALEKTKEQVVAAYKKNKKAPVRYLCNISGYPFYNTSEFTLKKLLDEAPSIVENMNFYIDSFSPNIKSIFAELEFKSEIKNLDKNNRLLGVVKKFSELDLNPETVDGIKMGYMFEEIIRRFSENAEAGDHYTPREVIRLLTSILLAEGCDDIYRPGREITVLDMACGTGGMLSTSHDFIKRMNPDANVRLFGQENNPESHAICLADMLIKNQDAENIRFADTMKQDCFEGTSMRFVIANPPFGIAWGGKDAGDGVEKAVRAEHKKGQYGRFPAGLPATGDMQLLLCNMRLARCKKEKVVVQSSLTDRHCFPEIQQAVKVRLDVGCWKRLYRSHYRIITATFLQHRHCYIRFYSVKNKSKERKNKIQLIDATDVWEPMRRSLGKKRREISRQQIRLITEVYTAFAEGEKHQYSEKRKTDCIIKSKIFDRNEFLYKEWAAYQPLQRSGIISDHTIEKLKTSAFFTSNAHVYNESTFMELEQTNPRSNKDEKAYQKMLRGKIY